ncbi:MAG: nuclear transport factor 2 family protein [Bacteroidota bacterium]
MELQQRIRQFYDAIIRRDSDEISAAYCTDEATYVVLEGPRLATKGHTAIAKGWVAFCDSKIALEKIEWIEGPFEEILGESGWLSGIIKLSVAIDGKEFTNTFRASFVLKKEGETWKIRHEHVSVAHPDPYGIGDWLP